MLALSPLDSSFLRGSLNYCPPPPKPRFLSVSLLPLPPLSAVWGGKEGTKTKTVGSRSASIDGRIFWQAHTHEEEIGKRRRLSKRRNVKFPGEKKS